MAERAAKTGTGPTALVAIEQYFPKSKRIIEDNLAYRILPSGIGILIRLMKPNFIRDWMVRATEKTLPGLWSGTMCRKRYIDDKLIDSLNKTGAVVNLGAGFDTRAYRLPALSNIPVWEVDQPENIGPKKTRLQRIFGEIPSNVRLLPIDFDREKLDRVFTLHDYSANKKTFFIWEAVTQYLTENGIRSTFNFLAKAIKDSYLVFTYLRKDFIDGKILYNWEKGYKHYVKNNIWLFGQKPGAWPEFLRDYGWRVIEDIGYDGLQEKYVKPTGRVLNSTLVERIVFAEKL